MLWSCLVCLMPLSAVWSVPKPQEKPKAILQELKKVEDIRRFIYPARLESKVNSTVTADLDGHVLKIVKNLGSPVRAGEVILYIGNQDPAFTYSNVPIRAPVSGILSGLYPQRMSKVAKGERLFTVMDTKSLHMMAEVPAADLPYLKLGLTGKFEHGSKGDSATVKIVGLSPVVDPRTGTASATVEFLDKQTVPMAPGSVGQIAFSITVGQTIWIPETAVSYFEGQPTVKVLSTDNKSSRKKFVIGEQREDMISIKDGLAEGERVVVRSNRTLKEGEEVEIQEPDKKETKN